MEDELVEKKTEKDLKQEEQKRNEAKQVQEISVLFSIIKSQSLMTLSRYTVKVSS